MNMISGDMQAAMALDRMNRLHAEAAGHRLAKAARSNGPGKLERLARSIDQALAAMRASFEIDRRPRIPAI